MSSAPVVFAPDPDPDPDPLGVEVEVGLCRARELVGDFVDRPGYRFSDAGVVANLRALAELAAVVEAARLVLIAELGARPEALASVGRAGRGGRVVRFLTEGLRESRGRAERDVAAAAALMSARAELPLLAQALAEGAVSREQVDVAVSVVGRLPTPVKTQVVTDDAGRSRAGVEIVDELLTGHAREWPSTSVERLGRQLVARLAPERADRFDPDAVVRRSCSIGTDWAGMGLYRLVLDPDTHLQISALIAQYSGPRPAGKARTGEGEVVTLPDPRTATQRRADAVTDLLLRGAGRPGWLASDHRAPQTGTPDTAAPQTEEPQTATPETATFEAETPETPETPE